MDWKEIDDDAKGYEVDKVSSKGVVYKARYAPKVLIWWDDMAFLTQWLIEENRWNGFSVKDTPRYYALVTPPTPDKSTDKE